MQKILKVKTGLFIPKELLKNLYRGGENVEIEIRESEIRIRPVKKEPIEKVDVPPFNPAESRFFSIRPFKMGKTDHSELDKIIYGG
jgi:hypothetical protein